MFPNTTGMTASVASVVSLIYIITIHINYLIMSLLQSFSALANLLILYLHKSRCVSFYLSAEDREQTSSSTKTDIDIMKRKGDEAWDELDKQAWPLICFTVGAFVGA